MAPRFKKMHFLNHLLLMLSSSLLFVALTNCIRVGSHLPHLPHHQVHQRQSFPSSNRRTSDGQFFFFATKDGLEVVPSGTKSGFVPLGTQNSGRFSDFATLINSNLKSSSSSSSFLDDNLKEETTRDVSQIRHAGKYRQMAFDKANLSAQPPLQPQPPRPQPRISVPQQAHPSAYEQTTASNKPTKIATSSPVFGARLSSVATSSIQAKSTVSNNTAPTVTTQPRPMTTSIPTRPTINRQKHSSSQSSSKSNSTLLEMLEECEHDEGEVDYIDNRDERLVGVTHLNISQDDLWNAESQAMEQILTAYGTKTQVPNLTHIIPEASEQSVVKTPMDPKDLGLDLGKSKSPEIDLTALFKDYKSPGIPFDPFRVFEQENGIVSGMPSSIPQNLIKSNTFEYFADNPTSSQIPSRQFETKPDFVSFGLQQGQNNENPKHFEWTPTRFSSTTSSASTFPSSSTSVLPDQTSSTPSMGPTESAFQSEFVSTQENIDNSINTNVNENENNNKIKIDHSNRSTLSSSSSISAQPQSNDSSPVTNINNSQQLASFDPKSAYENLQSVRKDYADPVIDPDNFESLKYGQSQSTAPTTTPGTSNTSPGTFFSDYKLSSDFYSSNRAIPSRYLSKQDSFNGHNGNTASILTGDSHWRGLTNYQQSNTGGGKQIGGDDGVSNYKQPQQQVNIRQHNEIVNHVTTPTEVPIVSSEVELSPNGRPIIRLIPKASVEVVPLPPPGEYNEPEIIHSGDYVVKVEKVPLKNLHDAYYNPEIPGESSLSSSSAHASTAAKSPSSQVKNGKNSSKSVSSNKLRNKNRKSQTSKKKSSSNTSTTRKASKSTSTSSKSKKQSSKAKTSARQETNKDKQEEEDTSLESPVIDDVADAAKNVTSNGADVDKVTNLGDSAVKKVTDGTTEVQDEVEDEIKGDEDKGSKETETEDEKKEETDKTETEADKSETEKEDATSEKPETEEEADTETSTEKPENEDNGSAEEKKEEDSEDMETSSESPSADTDDTSSDSTATTERPETTTTTTTPKPFPAYPPFPFPPPFPPFFFPPPYPPPHGGRYPPLPYPPPPPGAPYPPMPYPPPPPGYPPMPYGLPPPMYRPPGSSPPPPSPPPSYQPRPVSYTYTNAPQPPKPYGSQYQPPPPPSYQNSIAQNYGGSKYPKGYGSREPKVEFNGVPFEKTINLNSNNNHYPKPQSYNNNYQYPQHQQQPKPSYYQYSHGRRNDGAQPPPSQQRSGYGGSGYGYPKETVQNIHADIFLGDTKYPDNGYSQPMNSYPPNGHNPYYPPSSYESVNPPAYPTYQTYPQQPETAKKPTYYERFANRVKKLLPKLRISSGDPYPPKLDANYKQIEKDPVAKEPISSPWNEMTLGEHEVDPNPPPVLYSCDKNRIGKCVLTHDQQQFANFPAMDSLQQQTFDGMEQTMANPFPAVANEPVAIAAAGQQQLQSTGSSTNTVTK